MRPTLVYVTPFRLSTDSAPNIGNVFVLCGTRAYLAQTDTFVSGISIVTRTLDCHPHTRCRTGVVTVMILMKAHGNTFIASIPSHLLCGPIISSYTCPLRK